MHRRTLLKLLASSPVWIAWPGLRMSARELRAQKLWRRCRPTDLQWPKPAEWNELKEQVGGNLLQPRNPIDACKSDVNSGAYKVLVKNMQNPYFVGDDPALTQSTGWIDAWTSAPSVYAVAAHRTEDVVAAVNFARNGNLRLVVRGGAHSYKGGSNAADSLLIWMRAMNDIHIHDRFVAQGCEGKQTPQPAVTLEAGTMWIDAYNAVTTEAGRYVQGGGCATVGVVGLIHGGGFGSFSKHYGMAAASLLEAEIVTADGVVRVINQYQEPDLFWAIKGGGGGSFGVVTKITLETHELPVYFGGVSLRIKADSDHSYRRLIERFVSFYSDNLFNAHWGESTKVQPDNTLTVGMVSHGLSKEDSEEVWRPFLDWINASPGDFKIEHCFIGSMNARNWWDADWRKTNLPSTVIPDSRPATAKTHIYWNDNEGEVSVFLHGYESIWLPALWLRHDHQKQLTDALFATSRHWPVELHFNKGLAGAPAEAIAAARNTAMNPVVCDSFALAIIAGGKQACPGFPGHEPDLAAARKDGHDIKSAMNELRKFIPEPAAYVSESSFFERSWQRSFWGSNYARLRSIKAKYDPDGLFFVHHGVGSEDWSKDGFTRLDKA